MNKEYYIDNLSNDLLILKELIDNIKYSGLCDRDKNKSLQLLNEKYYKVHCVFKREIIKYCS